VPQKPDDVVTLMTACIDLPGMTAREIWLLREIAHAWGMGIQADFDQSLQAEVMLLFMKCQLVMTHVPQP
jgi:hypothetical protein